jgi:hypothetical protein
MKSKTYKAQHLLGADVGNGITFVTDGKNGVEFASVRTPVEIQQLDGRGERGFTVGIAQRGNSWLGYHEGETIDFDHDSVTKQIVIVVNKGTEEEQRFSTMAFSPEEIEHDEDHRRLDYPDRVTQWWVIGDDANIYTRNPERDTSEDRIGSDYQLTLLLAGTVEYFNRHQYGTSEYDAIMVNVSWLLNCPPIYFDSQATYLWDFSGVYVVEYAGKLWTLNAQVQHVFPEGAGALGAMMLDEGGKLVNPFGKTEMSAVIDGGFGTTDWTLVRGTKVLIDTAWSIPGAINDMSKVLKKWARERFREDWNQQTCERAIRTGKHTIAKTGEVVSVQGWLDQLGSELWDQIDQGIVQEYLLGNVTKILLSGGMAHLIERHAVEAYPGLILDRSQFPTIANVPYHHMNAIGHVRLEKFRAAFEKKAAAGRKKQVQGA